MARLVALVVALGVALQLPGEAAGHGYISVPKCRLYECRPGGHNKRCMINSYANAQQLGNYPKTGPAFGIIASAGMAELRQLDEQGADRWWKNAMRPGRFTFEWIFPANHATKGFSYYITKVGWNPDAPLTSTGSFEATPFCRPPWKDGDKPPHKKEGKSLKHTCNIPKRSGYHVILAMWELGARGWYNVIDVDFSGNGGGGNGPAVSLPPSLDHYNNRNADSRNKHTPSYGKGRKPVGKGPEGGPRGPPELANGNRSPPRRPAGNPAPAPKKCEKRQGYTLCKGDNDRCCPGGTKCYAHSNQVSVCLQTCPAGWACAKGSTCQVASAYHLCRGRERCCPRNTKCYAYNNQVSACMAACPKGWRC